MRLLLYNIRYGLGFGPGLHWALPGIGYLFGNSANLLRIIDFIKSQDPDIVGLIEVDAGSIRTHRVNQADSVAKALGHYSVYQCKYGIESLNQHLPIVRKQGNAFLAAPHVHGERFHYFEKGIKRLIIELELEDVSVFLVHLSLKYRHRHAQLHSLHDLVMQSKKPVLIAGDFNTFWGEHEIYLFMKATGLRSANVRGLPSYPSRAPRKELDFVLYGRGIRVTHFSIPSVSFSDHLPLVCDFEIEHSSRAAA
ncbi:MAG TPA: endonuclease/exonuclease/phosphatase family protein [Gammaproteobacteria bacterium]|nr:endonuclease/exonuclease/phosphatase family protein [Gammaproteobacteria bacterium]